MSYNFNQHGAQGGAYGPRGAERPQGALSTLADWVSKSLEIDAPPTRTQALVGASFLSPDRRIARISCTCCPCCASPS